VYLQAGALLVAMGRRTSAESEYRGLL